MVDHSKPVSVWRTEAQRQSFRERRYDLMRQGVDFLEASGLDSQRVQELRDAVDHAAKLRVRSPARMEALAGQPAAKRFSMAVEEKVTMLEQDANVIDAIRAEVRPHVAWNDILRDLREETTEVEQSQIFRPFASGRDSERALRFIEPEVALRIKTSHAIDWSRTGLRPEQVRVLSDKAAHRVKELGARAVEIVSLDEVGGYFGVDEAMNEQADLASATEWTEQPAISGDYLVSMRDTSHAARSKLMALDLYSTIKVLEGQDRSGVDSSEVWNKVVSAPAMAGVVRPNGKSAVEVVLRNYDPTSSWHRMLDHRRIASWDNGIKSTFDPQAHVDPDVVLGRGGSENHGRAGASGALRSGLARAAELNAEGPDSQEEAQME